MKLYATITSERATKGQGGEYLDIEIMGHDKVTIARGKVRTSSEYGYLIEMFPVAYPDLLKIEIKGHGYKVTRKVSEAEKAKRQKGDRDWRIPDNHSDNCTCPDCSSIS